MRANKCVNCGGPLPPRHSKWCLKHECQMAQDRRNTAKYHKQVKGVGASRRKMRQPMPYNPKPCSYCGRPLGKTLNRFFHIHCHAVVSNKEGIGVFATSSSKRNGSFRSN